MIVRGGPTVPMHPGRLVGATSAFVNTSSVGLRSSCTQHYMAKTVGGDSVDQDELPWSSSQSWVYPITDGAIAGAVTGGCTTTASARARGFITADATGTASGTAHLRGVRYAGGTATGAASTTAHPKGRGYINATLSIGSRPTADDVAQAVWGALLTINEEPNTMAERMQKLLTVAKFLGLK